MNRVLLIADEASQVRQVVGLLEAASGDFPCECLVVGDVATALDSLRQSGMGAVLLDLSPSTGGPGGLDALQRLAQAAPEVPVVVLTAPDDSMLALQALRAGAAGFLVKGADLDRELVGVVRNVLEESRNRERLRRGDQHLRMISEQLAVSFWTTNVQNEVTSCSLTGPLGCRPDSRTLAGRRLADLFGSEPPDEEFFDAHRQAVAGQARSCDVRWNDRVYHVHVEPLRQRDGHVVGAVGLALDVTDQLLVNCELRLTRQIQQSLRPAGPPRMPGFEVAGRGYASAAAGGDYFDYFSFPDGDTGFVICDVGGSGLGPAMLMAQTRAYLRAIAEAEPDPGRILTRLNQFLYNEAAEQRLVALFLAKVNPFTRRVIYAAAGHRSQRLRSDGTWAELAPACIPLNIRPQVVYASYAESPLEPGELLLLYTDGIIECMGPNDATYGTPRMLDLVRDCRDLPAQEIVDRLFAAVWEYGQGESHDDMTSVVIKAREVAVESPAGESCAEAASGENPALQSLAVDS